MRLRQLLVAFIALFIAVSALIWVSVQQITEEWSPLLESRIRSRQQSASIRVMARNHKGEKEWVASIVDGRFETRKNLTLPEVNPLLLHAIVELEDSRFLEHGGFDFRGIARAALIDVLTLSRREGASTITQQLVKNLFLTHEKTFTRKFKEFVLSILLERRFQKDEILEAYINEVFLGQVEYPDVLGLARASEYYFGKNQSELDAAEAALLAAMVAGSGYYSPFKHPDRALARRAKVLRILLDSQQITQEEYDVAIQTPLPKEARPSFSSRASYAVEEIRNELIQRDGELMVLKGGFEVETTLDPDLQKLSEGLFLSQSKSWPANLQVALVGIDPTTCEYKVYQGGTSYTKTQYNRLTLAKRPPGSLMKPLLITPLLDHDPKTYLAMHLDDSAYTWSYDKGRGSWSPQNYDRKFRGDVTLRYTLENSLNVPFSKLFEEKVPEGLLYNTYKEILPWGLDIPVDRALPSSLLGSVEQRPIDMARAYVGLTRTALGLQNFSEKTCDLKFLTEMGTNTVNPQNSALSANSSSSEATHESNGQVGSLIAIEAMRGVVRRGTAKVLGPMLGPNQPWAGKTGTSSDKRDAWFVALSPRLVLLAWLGIDENKETQYTGAWLAGNLIAPLLKSYSQSLPSEGFSWPTNSQLEWKIVDLDNGCEYAGSYAHELKEKFKGEPKNQTDLPNEAIVDGHRLAFELFKHSDDIPICH